MIQRIYMSEKFFIPAYHQFFLKNDKICIMSFKNVTNLKKGLYVALIMSQVNKFVGKTSDISNISRPWCLFASSSYCWLQDHSTFQLKERLWLSLR